MNFMASRRGFYEDGSKGWVDNNDEQEDENGLRCYLGGVSDQPELMMDSSSPTAGGGEESSDGLPGGGTTTTELGIGRNSGNNDNNNEVQVIEREHMFDKVVTPSDVGKLNRLVIPKQHAERYFPLDSTANEKGLLLNFEDRNGKPWRFRYSYWNSSQSYVMTKGWSRFVKEKKLDAGDIVSFQRGLGEIGKDRLFIDWRRRPDAPELLPSPIHGFAFPSFRQGNYNHPYLLPPQGREQQQQQQQQRHLHYLQANAINTQSQLNHGYAYGTNSNNLYGSGSVFYLKSARGGGGGPPFQQVGMVQLQRGDGGGNGSSSGGGSGGGGIGFGVEGMPIHHHPHHHHHPMVFESVPVVQGKAAAKRLRLFGVNMECPISDSDECDILSSTTVPHSTITPQTSHISSSSSSFPPRPYNANDVVLNKGKASMSLDLDI